MATAGRHTILVVEDETAVRELLTTTLQSEGYAVAAAPDGLAAIRAISEQRRPGAQLGLVLLDLMLPGVDGLEVMRHLATVGTGVPVIAISASRAYLDAAAARGARATLPKPFDLGALLAAVASCCPR
jgi:two-component system response regulator MprA